MKNLSAFISKFMIISAASIGLALAAEMPASTEQSTPEEHSSSFAPAPDTSAGTASTFQSSGDPTLDFFLAMQQCAPGVYQQKNSLSATVGPDWLQQTVLGPSADGCKVLLTTPDSRAMYCTFNPVDLQAMRDHHFLRGMMTDSATDASQDSINADLTWTQIKNNSCSYTPFE